MPVKGKDILQPTSPVPGSTWGQGSPPTPFKPPPPGRRCAPGRALCAPRRPALPRKCPCLLSALCTLACIPALASPARPRPLFRTQQGPRAPQGPSWARTFPLPLAVSLATWGPGADWLGCSVFVSTECERKTSAALLAVAPRLPGQRTAQLLLSGVHVAP